MSLLGDGLRFLIAIPAVAIGAIGAYLTLLGVAALVARPHAPRPGPERRRFAVLVPAHDEAGTVARAIGSVRAQSYPPSRIDVFVVADNCADATGDVARAAGAHAYERHDTALRGKGHALRWLLGRIRERHGVYDAFIVLDADSVVSPRFASQMDARLDAGSRVIQAHYRVLNPTVSATSALREVALASLHYLRPLGRSALGLSCGLKGNGMCFAADVLDRYGWSTTGLAEDVELHLGLVRSGIRVDFAPEATVRADMPASFGDATSQNLRWEAGRLSALRGAVPALIAHGIATRDAIALDAAIEQLIPPLSVAFASGASLSALAWATGATTALVCAAGGTIAIGAHIVAGLVATRAPLRTYLSLAGAPRYVLWKCALYVRALMTPADAPWIRTRRQPPATGHR